MGSVGEKTLRVAEAAVQTADHAVQGGAEALEFVTCIRDGQALAKIVQADAFSALDDAADGMERPYFLMGTGTDPDQIDQQDAWLIHTG